MNQLVGIVEHGKGLGHTVNMPTANLRVKHGTLPPPGVYATLCWIHGLPYRGVTNIGCRPTVDSSQTATIETFLLDFHGDIYGCEMKIEVRFFLREVRKFGSLQEVCAQVEKDADRARQLIQL